MNSWPISPLTPRDLDFAVVNYDFTGLTADELSPLPDLESAIDTSLLDFAASITDQTTLINSMAGDLDDLGVILNEMSSDDFQQILTDLAGIASTGDGLLNDFATMTG